MNFSFPSKTMTQQSTLELAKQGNPEAIAALINRSLQPRGITAKARVESGCLHIILESEATPNQQALVPSLCKGIKGLGIGAVKNMIIYGHYKGDESPEWNELVELEQPLAEGSSEEKEARTPVKLAGKAIEASTYR